ncbi:hypothetical protein EVAR_33277_1 [Eumeta japonica]|uniref:Uncharacterized protein n=1 Tax=Eumeta variegata TaxID=151549 RepID=A0A4C1X2Z6_EUMVA|nr:hypothetical protein EVAR_33277_1 [Eumeta japonica]
MTVGKKAKWKCQCCISKLNRKTDTPTRPAGPSGQGGSSDRVNSGVLVNTAKGNKQSRPVLDGAEHVTEEVLSSYLGITTSISNTISEILST